jgi:hypothetical protein
MTLSAIHPSETLEVAGLHRLGEIRGKSWHADSHGEYETLAAVPVAGLGDVLPDDVRLLHEVVRVPGSMTELGGKREARLAVDEDRWHKVRVHEPGAYAKAAEREAWRQAGIERRKAPQPARPLLTEPVAFQGREATHLPFQVPEPPETTLARLQTGIDSPGPASIDFREQPRIRGREAVMGWLARKGVELELVNSRVLASAPFATPEIREVLGAYRRLLPEWAGGRDVSCDRCAQPAVAVALLDVLLCQRHASEASAE